jgi:hypothetical protein
MLKKVERGGLGILSAPGVENDFGISMAFTSGKHGGSGHQFKALNLSYDVGDDRKVVTSNRILLAEAFGIPPENWVLCQQVHGSRVNIVGELERGRGGLDHWSAMPRTDGLVTDKAGIALGILTADCLPLAMVCGSAKVVGVAHVGWRGALYGVATAAIRRMLEFPGCTPEEVIAFLGPCIGPCCLEVGSDVAAEFRRFHIDVAISGGNNGSPRLDLASTCRDQLISAGVKSNNIFTAGVCTRCDDEYFSYRGSGGKTGRQAGIVAIL